MVYGGFIMKENHVKDSLINFKGVKYGKEEEKLIFLKMLKKIY